MLRRSGSDFNPNLEIFLYCNRLQLAAKAALYSDGKKYLPAVIAVQQLKSFLPSVKNALLLGGGLGSIIEVIGRKGYMPQFTLVERDKVVLKWAMEFIAEDYKGKIVPVCIDAREFMRQNNAVYDFIFIDIFDDLTVPQFVYSKEFLEHCKRCIAHGGYLAFNYIAANTEENALVQKTFAEVFPNQWIATTDRNQVFISGAMV